MSRSNTRAQLDRAVVAEDQIRTVLQTFKDKLFTELFPGRKTVRGKGLFVTAPEERS